MWSLDTGQLIHNLVGHTSPVSLIGVSSTNIVSASTDLTLRVWDPSAGSLKHLLAAHTDAITCFQHDECKLLSGSDGFF
jgi:F-box and WD-40 domain protein CDC4